ncbi:hypothetical protein JOQ06_009712 [Pogonophryne albipinna]|uniref:Uncharacterized protein n=1 Tax=Pogonophryne albipinna TaxID=1090488 RepID=A0AAD6BRN4_9TELE|nr:hypothetical protein JOQ06_009712 [Pogonophryne albipinna]
MGIIITFIGRVLAIDSLNTILKTANSILRRGCSARMKAMRRDELVVEEGEQEIRRRAAEQAEKWLVKFRGDLEEKRRERGRGEEETIEREEWENRKSDILHV